MNRADLQSLSNAQMIVLCNEQDVPEGEKEEMIEALLECSEPTVTVED